MSKKSNLFLTATLIIEKPEGIMIVKRNIPPFKGQWNLPGGHLEPGKESVEQAAIRELKEETNLSAKLSDLKLLGVYSRPKRDPRIQTVTLSYLVKNTKGKIKAGSDAEEFKFVKNIPKLAFDHNKIIKDYFKQKRR